MSVNIVQSVVRVIPWASRSDTLTCGDTALSGKVTRGKEALLRHRACGPEGESEEFTDLLGHGAETWPSERTQFLGPRVVVRGVFCESWPRRGGDAER